MKKGDKPDIRLFFRSKCTGVQDTGTEPVQGPGNVQETVIEGSVEHMDDSSTQKEPTPSCSTTSTDNPRTLLLSCSSQDEPVQPIIDFPSENGRKFSVRYYKAHQWLEYSVAQDACYCFPCRHFVPSTSVRSGETLGNRTFIDKGFRKWKDATALFQQHERAERHKSSMIAWGELKSRSSKKMAAASLLNSQRSVEIEENRKHLKILLKVTRFLGMQGLAFRGHNEKEESSNRGNFKELLDIMTEDDKNMQQRIQRRYGHYSSPEYQNDFIGVFSARVVQNICTEVKEAKFFSVMADETKDLSKSEQLAVLVRYVDKHSKINERALTLHHLKDCNAETVSKTIVSALTNEGLDLNFCVGQCYDGANVMSGISGGVQAKLKEHVPHATYLHCHAHRLNLVLVHTLNQNDQIKDFFSTVQKLYNFISNSSTRHELFMSAQERLGMPVLHLERTVPTRWFYWYSSVKKVRQTFQAILIVLDEGNKDKSESLGLSVQIQQSNFIFYLHAMESILGTTHILSEQLQENDLDLSAAVTLIEATRKVLVDARTDEAFNKILVKAKSASEKCGIEWSNDKKKKRKTAIPMKFQSDLVYCSVGHNQRDASTSEEDCPEIKSVYFEILDLIISEFDRRFTNSDFVYSVAKCFKKESESFLEYDKLRPFLDYYGRLLDWDVIQLQLPLAKAHILNVCSEDSVISFLNALKVLPVAYSEVIKVLQLFATLPITTAGNERFFSVMKRVKNFLRTTTSDERLCSLMLMAVEREEVKNLDLDQLVNDFAALRSRRYPLLH